jgi:hypothetical protein
MTRHIFDPNTGNAEHGGMGRTPPAAGQIPRSSDHDANQTPYSPTGILDFPPAANVPHVEISAEDDGRILLIDISGKLQTSDYEQFVPVLEKAIQKRGKIRILVRMNNFHGWDAGALWEDIKFDAEYFNCIERLALVGEKTWEKWMALFCKPFTTATIRYFSPEKRIEAREWLGE